MTPEVKFNLDLRDFCRIHDGLRAYATLSGEEAMARVKEHKEDIFCEVTNYAGDGKLMCTRDASDAIIDLAERQRDSMPVQDDYSVQELVEGISKHVVRAIVEEKHDEAALSRILVEAVNEANKRHVERTYHFPSVVVPYDKPPQFKIGIVTFTSARAFPEAFGREIGDYLKTSSGEKYSTEQPEKFREFISTFGWVASVTVTPCAQESAKRRAEVAVATAINLLRLLFGLHYGQDMRVIHLAYTQPSHTGYAVTENGSLAFCWSGRGSGALVEENWYLEMEQQRGFWNLAAHLVSVTVAGKRSEVADRVIDALTWFGEAAFESAPGVQIVNFVAALERLTTTEWFSPHSFCSRVAMLAYNDDADFEKTYWDAYATHTTRSEVIHGSYSPTSPAFSKSLRLAHDLTRNALFRGLELHSLLDGGGKTSSLDDLQSFFAKQRSKWESLLKKLGPECKARTEKKRHALTKGSTAVHLNRT